MLISCEKCAKNFEVADNLIPKEGRLVQCGSCDFKWFYKKEIKIDKEPSKTEFTDKIKKEIKPDETPKVSSNIHEIESDNLIDNVEIIKDKAQITTITNKKINYLKIFIVIIITFVAIIIIVDTFKHQISFIYPDIETLLSNLYESLRDINLFLRDLIK